jgi:hypothetical protein
MAFTIDNTQPGNGRQFKESGSTANIADIGEENLGGKGFDVISDTGTHTPATGLCYKALHCLTATVVASFVADTSGPVVGTFAGVTLAAGTVIYGKFTQLVLTSGSVIAYNGAI